MAKDKTELKDCSKCNEVLKVDEVLYCKLRLKCEILTETARVKEKDCGFYREKR